MDRAVSWLSFLVQGARSNFWGLGCPAYCGHFPLSSFALLFILGWICGILTAIWTLNFLAPWFWPQPDPAPVTSTASLRLAGYLHERGPLRQRRR